jgi:hypothetical protein
MSSVSATPASESRFAIANVGRGCLLDSRRALVHETQGWMTVADLHHGFELNQVRKHGTLLPQWNMAATERRLMTLLQHHKPRTLILNGDIMEGGGSVRDTERFVNRVRDCVAELVLIEGNHDRSMVKHGLPFVRHWHIGSFVFHHGHKWQRTLNELGDNLGIIHICGHEHPALQLNDGTGNKLKFPALIQDRLKSHPAVEHWILPAFSPWAGGSVYESENERLSTWMCSAAHILPVKL